MKKLSILMVCEYYYPHIGGVEIVFQNLAERFVKLGHEVNVVTLRVKNSEKFEIKNGVKIHRVNVPEKGDRYFFAFLGIKKVLELAKKADIIHATLYTGAVPAWIAKKIFKKKAILSVHEIFGDRWQELFEMNFLSAMIHKYFEKMLLLLNFDYYIAVSDATKKDFEKCKKNKNVARIYNGISKFEKKFDKKLTRNELGIKENEFIYLYYGRPGISKGLEYLIKAVPYISEKIKNSRFLLVLSKKPYSGYQKIMDLIEKLNIKEKIIQKESVNYEDLPKIINSADCVVIPSLAEGFGFSAAESCEMGMPVVVSRAGSLPEVVSGEVVFIDPKSELSIAEGVCKMEKKEFEKIEKKEFSWESSVSEYLKIYKNLI